MELKKSIEINPRIFESTQGKRAPERFSYLLAIGALVTSGKFILEVVITPAWLKS